MSNLQISVIITTLNREEDIGLTLDRLAEQNFAPENFEVLVVDGGSTDGTERAVQNRIETYPRHSFRFLVETEPGVAAARHLGADEARGELLVYIEDDARAEPTTLAAVVECFADPDVHLVGGRCVPDYDSTPPDWMEVFFERDGSGFKCGSLSLIDQGDQIKETSPHNIWALNFSIRRKTLYDLGGFHPDLMPPGYKEFQGDGESGVSNKMIQAELKAMYHPGVCVHHRIQADRFNAAYFEKRFRFQGICDSYTALRNGGELADESGSVVLGSSAKLSQLLKAPWRVPGIIWRKFAQRGEREPSETAVLSKQYYKRALEAYRGGFEFHRNSVRKNPALLDWIRRPDYFGARVDEYTRKEIAHD